MSLTSDESRFTSAVLGEAPPADQQALEEAMQRSSALRHEAESVLRAGEILAAALKSQPRRTLTPVQRQAVFRNEPVLRAEGGAGSAMPRFSTARRPATTLGAGSGTAFAAAAAIGSVQASGRARTRLFSSLAATGLAAALAMGFFTLQSRSLTRPGRSAQVPAADGGAGAGSAIPVIAIQPEDPSGAAAGKPGSRIPAAPPVPALSGTWLENGPLPGGSPAPGSSVTAPSASMAAVPPAVRVIREPETPPQSAPRPVGAPSSGDLAAPPPPAHPPGPERPAGR